MKTFFTIISIILIVTNINSQELKQLEVGNKIPNFEAKNEMGEVWKSSSIDTDFLVVYFYPAAMTGGCTKQACTYRDNKTTFDKMGVTVVGVSGDEIEGLQHFKESYQLNFPLLSDKEGKIAQLFGVPISKGGEFETDNFLMIRGITSQRWTFVLDKNRKIIYKNAEVNATEDSKNVLEAIRNHTN